MISSTARLRSSDTKAQTRPDFVNPSGNTPLEESFPATGSFFCAPSKAATQQGQVDDLTLFKGSPPAASLRP